MDLMWSMKWEKAHEDRWTASLKSKSRQAFVVESDAVKPNKLQNRNIG